MNIVEVITQEEYTGEDISDITAIMREADLMFQKTGGSTRHYIRDVFLPMLKEKGLYICKRPIDKKKSEIDVNAPDQ